MLNRKPKAFKENRPLANAKKHTVIVSLSDADYRQASLESKVTKQTVAAWIANLVNTSTQP
jgi:hypothetical protein